MIEASDMVTATNRDDLSRIVVLNPKGGCGKTSLATNLASYFALRGPMPTLLDCDPQGASTALAGKTLPVAAADPWHRCIQTVGQCHPYPGRCAYPGRHDR